MGSLARLRLYGERGVEFVAGDPRESNTEGGIFPAIFGTVLMVFLMSFAVAPMGVLAALYLREYAKQGPLVRSLASYAVPRQGSSRTRSRTRRIVTPQVAPALRHAGERSQTTVNAFLIVGPWVGYQPDSP